MTTPTFRILALLAVAAGCGTSAAVTASGLFDAGADAGSGRSTASDAGDGGPVAADAGDGGLLDGDADAPCARITAQAQESLMSLVAVNGSCDADLNCAVLLWPSCLGCGAYSINEAGVPTVTAAIGGACTNFNAEGCPAPAGSCPTSYGLGCVSGECTAIPPLLGP